MRLLPDTILAKLHAQKDMAESKVIKQNIQMKIDLLLKKRKDNDND